MSEMKKDVIMNTNLLCKSYVSDGEINNVIKNMNLEIAEGDFTVIMGSSGSGKSTLLYLLSGMIEATSGEAYLKGTKITGRKEKEMAAIRKNQFGFVFQAINLIPDLTIYENTASPAYQTKRSKEEIEQEILRLAETMEMTDQLQKFPGQLSGGQRQRAAICRALINHPDILFADEPTGALNHAQGENVLDELTKIHEKGQTVVMVTHDLKAALRGNRILYLTDGRIDGDLHLGEFSQEDCVAREKCVYEFLKERGW